MPMIPLGEWAPDRALHGVSGYMLEDAKNCVPRVDGYAAQRDFVTHNKGSLSELCRGAFSGRSSDANARNFIVAGSLTDLYYADTGTLSSVKGSLTTASDGFWEMALFDSRVICVNGAAADLPQSFLVATSPTVADLSADASKARHVGIIRDQVFLGNVVGQGANAAVIGEDAVHWSGIGDETSWQTVGTDAAKSVLSGWQALIDHGGAVTGILGGEDYGIILKERSIWRADFEGGDTFWRFTPVNNDRGCIIPGAGIRVGNDVYYPSEDGFFRDTGSESVPIGLERVNDWFFDQIDSDNYHRVSKVHDPTRQLIGWGFMGTGASADLMNRILFYNYGIDRWSYAEITHEWLVSMLAFGDSLDTGTLSATDMDTVSTSLDLVTGSNIRQMAAFDSSHELGTLTGDVLAANFLGKYEEASPGRLSLINSVRPVYESSGDPNVLAVVRTRKVPNGDETIVSGAFTVDRAGKFPLRASGRYHQINVVFGADDFLFNGVDIDAVPMGLA